METSLQNKAEIQEPEAINQSLDFAYVLAQLDEIQNLSMGFEGEIQLKNKARKEWQQQTINNIDEAATDLFYYCEKNLSALLLNSEARKYLLNWKPLVNIYSKSNSIGMNFLNSLSQLALEMPEDLQIIHCEGVTFLILFPTEIFASEIAKRELLFVGERDFSFANIFSVTHPETFGKLLATDYPPFNEALKSTFCNRGISQYSFTTMWEVLRKNGMVAFGVDATNLNQYDFLKLKSLKRIQFNCPYAENEGKVSHESSKALVTNFFKSSRPLLNDQEGRLHISIQQPQEPVKGAAWNKKAYQQAFGVTPELALQCNLAFVKALGNIEKRYSDNVSQLPDAAFSNGSSENEMIDFGPARPVYEAYLTGTTGKKRVNQLIFKPTAAARIKNVDEYFDYSTDSGDSDDEPTLKH